MRLTKKQRLFVEEYLECWNATEAARRAGYSERSIRSIASENLTKPNIRELIKRRLEEKTMKADEVLTRLSEQARADMIDFITIDETGRPIINLAAAEGKTHLIKSVRETKDAITIELYNAQAALSLMGKAYGIFKERYEVGLDESTRQLLAPFFALIARYIPADKMEEFKAQMRKIAGEEDA